MGVNIVREKGFDKYRVALFKSPLTSGISAPPFSWGWLLNSKYIPVAVRETEKKRKLKNETMQEGTGWNALSSIHGRETRIAPKITAWGLKPWHFQPRIIETASAQRKNDQLSPKWQTTAALHIWSLAQANSLTTYTFKKKNPLRQLFL